MRARSTLLLWMVVAALGAYLWHTGRSPEVAPPETAPLIPFRPEEATALVVADAERTVRLRRAESGWLDERGRPWPAPELLHTLLEALAEARPTAMISDDPVRLADYGLDPPRRSVTVTTAATGERTLTLALGDRNPVWTGVYARRPPDPDVVLVGSVLLWELDKVFSAVRQADPPPALRPPD
jgi:hypothetical protein